MKAFDHTRPVVRYRYRLLREKSCLGPCTSIIAEAHQILTTNIQYTPDVSVCDISCTCYISRNTQNTIDIVTMHTAENLVLYTYIYNMFLSMLLHLTPSFFIANFAACTIYLYS